MSLSASAQEEIVVYTSNSIIGDVVQNVLGDVAEARTLIPRNTDPHSYLPNAQMIGQLSQADLIFINGMNLEEGLLNTLQNSVAGDKIMVISSCVPVRTFAEDADHETDEMPILAPSEKCEAYTELINHYEPYSPDYKTDSIIGYYADLACDATQESDETDHHDHGICDPHVWHDPINVMYWTLSARDALIKIDPQHSDQYQKNADQYLASLASLNKEEILPLIASLDEGKKDLIINHNAISYFAAAYGFKVIDHIIPGGSTLSEPSAQDLGKIINFIQTYQIKAIFTEFTASSNLAEQIAQETGTKLVPLYTDALSEADGPASTYLDFIRYNTQAIVDALKAS
ncbi:metal ABC transporter substrate-binding protein [Anaerolineales bacterium]